MQQSNTPSRGLSSKLLSVGICISNFNSKIKSVKKNAWGKQEDRQTDRQTDGMSALYVSLLPPLVSQRGTVWSKPFPTSLHPSYCVQLMVIMHYEWDNKTKSALVSYCQPGQSMTRKITKCSANMSSLSRKPPVLFSIFLSNHPLSVSISLFPIPLIISSQVSSFKCLVLLVVHRLTKCLLAGSFSTTQ